MPLSMTSQIRMDEIDDVDVLRPGTVYCLIGLNGEKLVVKSEAANLTTASFNTTKAAMKIVDANAANTKALTDGEKLAIKTFAEGMKGVIDFMTEHRIPGAKPSASIADLIANFQQNPHALWYKMPYAQLTDMKDALGKRVGGVVDKSPMKAFADALSAKGGLESLGAIIACDLFIGNSDRFNPKEGSKLTFGNRQFDFRVIKNIANIFLAKNGSSSSVTGMDFVDPSTGFRHYDMTLDEVKQSYNEDWLGDVLVNKAERHAFAGLVIEDLELVLCPNRKRFSPFTKLGRDAQKRLEKGMVDGGKRILAGLEQKYKTKAPPAGMASRLAELKKL